MQRCDVAPLENNRPSSTKLATTSNSMLKKKIGRLTAC